MQIADDVKEAVARKVHHSTLHTDELAKQLYEAHKAIPQSAEKENKPDDQKAPHPLISKPAIRCLVHAVRSSTMHAEAPSCRDQASRAGSGRRQHSGWGIAGLEQHASAALSLHVG